MNRSLLYDERFEEGIVVRCRSDNTEDDVRAGAVGRDVLVGGCEHGRVEPQIE